MVLVLGRQAVPKNSFWRLSAYEKSYFCSRKLPPSLKLTWHLKIHHWKRRFLLETIIFGCYVSFKEGKFQGVISITGSLFASSSLRPRCCSSPLPPACAAPMPENGAGSRAIRRRKQGETRVGFVNYPAQNNIYKFK